MPLTGVGKVFKPALRWEAARRVTTTMLADLGQQARSAEEGGHPVFGSLITVTVGGVPPEARAALEAQVNQRLAPLTMRHEVAWR
jgi:fatty-acyl-CoA synthase